MTEQPTTPRPDRPLPRLGHGIHWSEIVAEIDRDHLARTRDAEPAPSSEVAEEEVPQVEEPSTPSLGEAGSPLGAAAMHTCADYCQCDETHCRACADTGHVCEDHPDRPWGGITDDINGCHCGGAGVPCPECCDPIPEDGTGSIGDAFTPRKFARGGVVDFSKPGFGIVGIEEARSWGITPPPAVELLAMADDLNTHGGLDETFVAALLRAAADPLADAKRGLGIVDALPPVMTTEPSADAAQHLLDTIHEWLGKVPPPPKPVKLTADQIATVQRNTPPPEPFAPDRSFWGVPVEIVETVEESTPYQLANAQPSGILKIRQPLTDTEYEQLRAAWTSEYGAAPTRIMPMVEPSFQRVGVVGPLPVPVDLRPRPWWRRALDRARRWGR